MAEFYDIDYNFNIDASGDIALVEDNDAISQSIKTIILTPKGGKVGTGLVNPIFGVGIKQYMFAPLTEFVARSLGEVIMRNLTMFEPRISIQNISVDVDKDNRKFLINIFYVISKTDEEFTYRTVINQL